MNNTHVTGELSAYLDGEARDPERIARHLQHCTACAKTYVQLRKVSTRMRNLEEPDVREDLVDQVLRAIAERHQPAGAAPARRPLLPRPLGLAMAMASVLALVTAIWAAWLSMQQPSPGELVAQAARYRSEEAVLEALVYLAEQGNDLSLFVAGEPELELEEPPGAVEDMIALLALAEADAEPGWNEMHGPPWRHTDALFGALDELQPEEQAAFEELLREQANEG